MGKIVFVFFGYAPASTPRALLPLQLLREKKEVCATQCTQCRSVSCPRRASGKNGSFARRK